MQLSIVLLYLFGCRDELDLPSSTYKAVKPSFTYKPGSSVKTAPIKDETPSYPLLVISPSKICSEITFYNADGDLVQGTRNCDETSDSILRPELIREGITIEGVLGTAQVLDENIEVSAQDVRIGVEVGGVTGSLLPLPHTCHVSGELGCVTTDEFRAVQTSDLSKKVVSGASVAGIAGTAVAETHNSCTAAQQSNCITTANFKNMNFAAGGISIPDLTASNFHASLATAGNFEFWDSQGARHLISGDSNLTPAKIASGLVILGIAGNASPEGHVSCSGGNQSGCVATPTFRTMDLSLASATPDLTAANFTATLPSSGNFEFWDSQGNRHLGSGDSDLVATNIAAGSEIHGVSGTLILEAHTSCSGPNQSSCIATPLFKTMDLSAAGTDAVLNSTNFDSKIGSAGNFEFWDAGGQRHSVAGDSDLASSSILSGKTIFGVAGSAATRPADCASSGSQECVATGSYRAATNCAADGSNCYLANYVSSSQALKAISYDEIDSGKSQMHSSLTLSGISGTLQDCIANGAVACVTTSSFRSADLSNLSPGNIKRGETIAGTTGNFPSAASPLPRYADAGATINTVGADLTDLSNFSSQLANDGSFEFWESSGVRRTGNGDADLIAAKVKNQVELENLALTGSYGGYSVCSADGQSACLSTVNLPAVDTATYSNWDIRKGKTAGGIAGSLTFFKNMIDLGTFNRTTGTGASAGADSYDTIDDSQHGTPGSLPTTAPSGWDQATGENWTAVLANQAYRDEISGLHWTADQGQAQWEDAITHCENLNSYAARSDWRLATSKEMFQAHIDGIWFHSASLALVSGSYWGATSNQWDEGQIVRLDSGASSAQTKTNLARIICVAP